MSRERKDALKNRDEKERNMIVFGRPRGAVRVETLLWGLGTGLVGALVLKLFFRAPLFLALAAAFVFGLLGALLASGPGEGEAQGEGEEVKRKKEPDKRKKLRVGYRSILLSIMIIVGAALWLAAVILLRLPPVVALLAAGLMALGLFLFIELTEKDEDDEDLRRRRGEPERVEDEGLPPGHRELAKRARETLDSMAALRKEVADPSVTRCLDRLITAAEAYFSGLEAGGGVEELKEHSEFLEGRLEKTRQLVELYIEILESPEQGDEQRAALERAERVLAELGPVFERRARGEAGEGGEELEGPGLAAVLAELRRLRPGD